MTTQEFTNKLKEYNNIGAFIDENAHEFDEDAFRNYLETLLQRGGMTRSQLGTETGVTSYMYDMMKNPNENTGKNVLVRLALGLSLNLDETNRLLTLGGRAPLRSKVRRDAIIIFSIEQGYSIAQANDVLYDYGLQTLEKK